MGLTTVTTTTTTATTTTATVQVEVNHCMELSVGSGTQAIAHLGLIASAGIAARPVQTRVNLVRSIKPRLTTARARVPGASNVFSEGPDLSPCSQAFNWDTEDHIRAHTLIKASGKYNFEGLKIPVPTAIRFDRIRAALGNLATPQDQRAPSLLQ